MDLLGLTIFSAVIAFLGAFQAVPFTSIQPAYVFPERFQSVMGHVGHALTWVFSPRYLNGSLVYPGQFDTKLLSPPQFEESTAAYVSVPTNDSYPVLENHSSEPAPQSALAVVEPRGEEERVGLTWSNFYGLFSAYYKSLFRHYTSYPYDDTDHTLFWVAFVLAPFVVVNLVVHVIRSMFRREQFSKASEAADLELVGIVREIRNKKAAILQEFDDDLSAVAREVNDISTRIKSERERIYMELSTLRIGSLVNEQVDDIRSSLNSRFEHEFSAKMCNFTAELESARVNAISTTTPRKYHDLSTQTEPQPNNPDPNISTKRKEPNHQLLVEQPQRQPQQQVSDQFVENEANRHYADESTNNRTTPSPVILPESSDVADTSPTNAPNESPDSERRRRSRPGKAKRARMARRRDAEKNQNGQEVESESSQSESNHEDSSSNHHHHESRDYRENSDHQNVQLGSPSLMPPPLKLTELMAHRRPDDFTLYDE